MFFLGFGQYWTGPFQFGMQTAYLFFNPDPNYDKSAHSINKNIAMINRPLTDYQFYTSLKKYTPILYTGNGSPWFLLNQKWHSSFFFVIFCSIIYAVSIFFLHHYHNYKHEPENSPGKTIALTSINAFMLLGLLVSFLITQFINPGIRNIHLLTDEEFREFGKKYCLFCEKDVLETMQHCKQCCVCIHKRHHHCMFFEKCMGGGLQTYGFKFFLLFASFSCLTLFVTVIFYLV